MSRSFSYDFTDGTHLLVETEDNPSTISFGDSNLYMGFKIQTISGTIDGVTITGIVNKTSPNGSNFLGPDNSTSSFFDNIIFPDNSQGYSSSSYFGIDPLGLNFSASNGKHYTLSQNGQGFQVYFGTNFDDVDSRNLLPASIDAPCFATGTRIKTVRGDIEVEKLVVGDFVITGSGQHRRIRWIGSRTVEPSRYSPPELANPVRIRAHAFGQDRPARDLSVSPGHAIAFDIVGEVLIPAGSLVNGLTLLREEVSSVTYWHVELDSHDLLIAENQAVESYLDMGNRGFFAECAVVSIDAAPDVEPSTRTHAHFCRPFHPDGPLVDVVRSQLRLRAQSLGWRLIQPETWADVYLEVDGQIVRPKTRGLSACFLLTGEVKNVWLVCPTSIPREVGVNEDPRSLGLSLAGLRIDDGLGNPKRVALDDPLLCLGFHSMCEDHRWTAGRARLPAALFDGLDGPLFLNIDLAGAALPRWLAPELTKTADDLAIRAA